MSGPNSVLPEGRPARFSVVVYGGDLKVDETYSWKVSTGTITSGQGTSVITVDTTGSAGKIITATVTLGGIDPKCSSSRDVTAEVLGPTPPQVMPLAETTRPAATGTSPGTPKPAVPNKKAIRRKRPGLY